MYKINLVRFFVWRYLQRTFVCRGCYPSAMRGLGVVAVGSLWPDVLEEERACILCFIARKHYKEAALREFTADCHARVTEPLDVMWALPWKHTPPGYVTWLNSVLGVMRNASVWPMVRAVAMLKIDRILLNNRHRIHFFKNGNV